MLSLRKLKTFVKVAQIGSFSRAAEALYLTQAAVSQQVQELEAHLGVSLFERKSSGIALTRAGAALQKYALQMLTLSDQAENAVTDIVKMQAGDLRIGMTRPAAAYLVQTWLAAFHKEHPQFKTVLQTNSDAEALYKEILSGGLDIAFIEGEMDFKSQKIKVAELKNANLFVIFGAEHPWKERKSISIYEVAQQPLISCSRHSPLSNWLEGLFGSFKLSSHTVAEFDDPHAILMSVADGTGISVMPSCVFSGDTTTHNEAIHCALIEEVPEIRFPIQVIWSAHRAYSPVACAFMTLLSEDFPDVLPLLIDQPL
jgi:DNA-binding transcriptional LysR family regulator